MNMDEPLENLKVVCGKNHGFFALEILEIFKIQKGVVFMEIRIMSIDDYPAVYSLWRGIEGFGLRTIDDSYEGIARFLKRNPKTSIVAVEDEQVIGTILCGHDGRTGFFYHVCVEKSHRHRGIAKEMTQYAMDALREEGINKVSLVAFCSNENGNACWHELGWKEREDLNCYDYILNPNNTVNFNK